MRKMLLVMALCSMQMIATAQREVTLRVGTPIPLQSVNTIKGSEVKKGQQVSFRVARDIVVDGVVAIPYGTPVSGTVISRKKGKAWGYSGHVEVEATELVAPYGERVPLTNGKAYAKGKGRGVLAACCAIFYTIPSWFIHGTAGEIPAGYEVQASVAQVTALQVNAAPASPTTSQQQVPVAVPETPTQPQTVAQLQSATTVSQPQTVVQHDYTTPPLPANATITKKDGTVINAVVHAVDQETISYRKQTNPNGPMYKVSKASVADVRYQF